MNKYHEEIQERTKNWMESIKKSFFRKINEEKTNILRFQRKTTAIKKTQMEGVLDLKILVG